MESARTKLIESKHLKSMWPLAATYSGYVYMRQPVSLLKQQRLTTQCKLWTGTKPDVITHFHPFGCLEFAHTPASTRPQQLPSIHRYHLVFLTSKRFQIDVGAMVQVVVVTRMVHQDDHFPSQQE